MGGSVSQVFRSGSALLSNRDGKVSEHTIDKIHTVFEILRANPKISMQTLEGLLTQIAKYENVLAIHDECGYNLLQKSVGINHIELARWLLQRHRPDVNRSACSLPLHIACLKGYEECVELLLKHGARMDTEARMCFPGSHCNNCELSGKYRCVNDGVTGVCSPTHNERQNTKLQNAVCYAIDGDQISVLNILSQKMEEPWLPFRVKKPLLHLACEKGAWKCVQHLVIARNDEINLIKDEYYPIHQAVLHDQRFLELLIQHGAITTVRTCTQQMTLLHVVIFVARKSADDTLSTIKILLERGCKELINEPDSLGNTPLHALLVRYALEEARYGFHKWNKWDILSLVRFLLQNGAKNSINQAGNSALACVFRHVRDWEVCYELLNMLIKEDGDPNMVGRDGSVPIMVCLVPLINKDQLHHFTHSMKVCYLNCIRILLQHGANPNCSYRSNLTPLHVLIFTVSENLTLNCETQKQSNFDFIKNILLLLLQHGLDCNTYQHILQSIMDMVQNLRVSQDMLSIYELALTLIQYGANPNIVVNGKTTSGSAIVCNEIANFGDSIRTTNDQHSNSNSDSNNQANAGGYRNNNTSSDGSFRTHSRYILFYYIILISKKEFLLTDPKQTFARIIYLFYYSMSHEPLYNCLKCLHNFYVAQVPNRSTESLIALITSLYRRPRSLKQICRQTVYKSLNHKLAQNINKLNLPGPLKEYVLHFEDAINYDDGTTVYTNITNITNKTNNTSQSAKKKK